MISFERESNYMTSHKYFLNFPFSGSKHTKQLRPLNLTAQHKKCKNLVCPGKKLAPKGLEE